MHTHTPQEPTLKKDSTGVTVTSEVQEVYENLAVTTEAQKESDYLPETETRLTDNDLDALARIFEVFAQWDFEEKQKESNANLPNSPP